MAGLAGVLLHGRNRTPEDMIEIANRLHIDGMRWLAPAAESGSWYPHRFMEPVSSNEPFLTNAIDRCHQAVEDAREGGRLAPGQIVVLGFSQGACLAVEYALRRPESCRTLIVFTGGLIGPAGTAWRPSTGNLDGLRVLITGSDIDEWVPEARVRETASVMSSFGADVRMRLYKNRPHVVSDDEIDEARTFICQIKQSD